MGLRRGVEDRVGTEVRERVVHRLLVADVGAEKREARIRRREVGGIEADFLQALGNACIGQLVDDEDGRFGLLEKKPHEGGSDETGGAGHDAAFGIGHCQVPFRDGIIRSS